MTRYAQASKRWKKAAGNVLFFNRMVRGARALHCLTSGEAEASCDWRKPALVVGNGVELPAPARLRAVRQPLRAAFMGRLHVDHKGLDLLVDACGLIRNAWVSAGASLEIHGPDCGGSAAELRKRIARNGAGEVVDLKGPVLDRDKARFFNSIDVFLHPSRTEGHPIAVLEALAHGVPCLLTPNTNLAEEVVAAEAGWVVEATRGGCRGLLKLLDLSARVGDRRKKPCPPQPRSLHLADDCRAVDRRLSPYRLKTRCSSPSPLTSFPPPRSQAPAGTFTLWPPPPRSPSTSFPSSSLGAAWPPPPPFPLPTSFPETNSHLVPPPHLVPKLQLGSSSPGLHPPPFPSSTPSLLIPLLPLAPKLQLRGLLSPVYHLHPTARCSRSTGVAAGVSMILRRRLCV